MTATDRPTNGAAMRGQNGGIQNGTQDSGLEERLAKGLGWFSIGLGVAEIVAPGALARFIGVRDETKTRAVLRSYGVREIAAGVGILSQPRQPAWVWSRVAGDMLDLSSLASAFNSDTNNKGRLAFATAAVAGVTALDAVCGQRLSAKQQESGENQAKVTRTIIVDRSPEEAYQFWHNFNNLPTFMTYLESVQSRDNRHSHWVAVGPGGMRVEWDAEVTRDEPNQVIAWQSDPDAFFNNAGEVHFERAPGNRGTMVRVEMDFAPNGGPLNSIVGKVLGMDIGQRIVHDLRNFKQMLELGEVTQSDASIHEGMHAAQPAPQAA